MSEIVTWTADRLISPTIHSLLTIGIFIVTFLAIHPFQDGNGRLSRILTTLLSIEQATGESRSTIKARLKQLTIDRLLIRYGNGRSTWYGLS
jgi:fido (protein-threonine AMPylation protein)